MRPQRQIHYNESQKYVQALLTNGPEPGDSDICQDTWTLAEAVQAIVILANYHALSSLCLGVGARTATTSVFKIDKYLQMKSRGRLRGRTGDGSSEVLGLQQAGASINSNNALTLLDLKSSRLTLLDERKRWRQAQKELKRKRSFSEGEVVASLSSQDLFRVSNNFFLGEFTDRTAS